MVEPIGPEAYLAIAASLQNAVNSCRGKIRAEQNDKTTNTSNDSSKSTLASPADELLSYSDLRVGNGGYVQWLWVIWSIRGTGRGRGRPMILV